MNEGNEGLILRTEPEKDLRISRARTSKCGMFSIVWHGMAFWVGKESLGFGVCALCCIPVVSYELVRNRYIGRAMGAFSS